MSLALFAAVPLACIVTLLRHDLVSIYRPMGISAAELRTVAGMPTMSYAGDGRERRRRRAGDARLYLAHPQVLYLTRVAGGADGGPAGAISVGRRRRRWYAHRPEETSSCARCCVGCWR